MSFQPLDIEIQISERSSGWAINYRAAGYENLDKKAKMAEAGVESMPIPVL